ncbi:MAG TPA: Uma2 family endonuclease [Trichormus sp.]|jgi:Uma2 family endonuclease
MTVVEKFEYMTVEEYLKFEETSPIKHEYLDGRIFAMTGSNRRHNCIGGNIFAVLHGFLAGTPCQPFIEAMKARVKSANCFYYPDVMVACDEDADDESVYTENPVLIVEVLSPSTASVDRREKLTNYTKIPALVEYLIVHQRYRRVELYRKDHAGNWSKHELRGMDSISLESLLKGELTISLDTIYKNVSLKDGALEVQEDSEEYYISREEAEALDW